MMEENSQQDTARMPQLPFASTVRATGHGEVWSEMDEQAKLRQFGWRCTNSESLYKPRTLIGNWSEERFDVRHLRQDQPLPSQFDHYFRSNYMDTHSPGPKKVPAALKSARGTRQVRSFPIHQPELDLPRYRAAANSWETTTRSAYVDPRMRTQPLDTLSRQTCN